jgi:transglutaminase-like putative cysteine protease
MLIKVGYDIAFSCPEPMAMVLMLYLHPSRSPTIRRPERLLVEPQVPISEYIDTYGNRCGRIVAPAGRVTFRNEAIVEDCGLPDMQVWDAPQHNVQDLPDSVLLFLLASRYCEVDSELKETAWSLFGQTPPGWPRVQAICHFVHRHIRFDYMQARANRTAMEIFRERAGVCRDYMHLAITFCRCLNIPARYCTGYLGDIGVPRVPYPMDFSAWFEAFLGGQWYAFDARNLIPRIGRVLMARGRDAADVAMTTTFGVNQLQSFKVWTDEVHEDVLRKPSRSMAWVGQP